MSQNNLKLIGIAFVAAFVFLAAANWMLNDSPAPSNPRTNDPVTPTGSPQVIRLSLANYNYSPDTITVNANQPVRIEADLSTIDGCYRAFTIPSLGLQKVFTPADNKLEFTPTTRGSFPFSCAMGMGRGVLIVV